ncbi:MAG: hypothetical protein WAU70_16640 [Flavobacteriales bacterium]
MEERILHSPSELADAFAHAITGRLQVRLGYYLGHIPTEQEFHRTTHEQLEDGYSHRYTYRNEVLLIVDTRNPLRPKFSAWDPITEDEVNGSAPGPGAFQLQAGVVWDPFFVASELEIEYRPSAKPSSVDGPAKLR